MDLIIHGGSLPTFLLEHLLKATGATRVEPRPPQVVRLREAQRTPEFDALIPLIEAERLDWAFFPPERKLSDFGLIAFDMDSTLITIECIDELADFAGKKEEVSSVTEAAMRGEIDYRESLRRRLTLLAGLDARVLARVFSERLSLSPGARNLLEAAQNAGLRTAILSGGFTYFTERLRIELGFDFATSNELEISGGKLTGHVAGDIVDAAAKAHYLCRLRDELGLTREQIITVGDGANDLLMMAESGLSVAYHAKPATRARADVTINFGGLDALLNLFD
ncbi:MAG: phosphoserine phosphatase SerB [Azonexus sp.]|nr:phosphoserine phosphatase SerB [Azonexus sp.]